MTTRRYTFKLRPTQEQAHQIQEQCYMVGSLWNALLHMQEEMYRRTRGQRGVVHFDGQSHMSEYDMSYLITELREACPEWCELSTWTPRRVCKALDQAFAAFFRRAKQGAGAQSGYPRYKSQRRGEHNWLPHRFASGCKMTHVAGTRWSLALKGVDGPIRCRGQFPDSPTRFTDADIRLRQGTWWMSVAVEIERTRASGFRPVEVRMDGIDCFAYVNGRAVYRQDLRLPDRDPRIEALQQDIAALPRDEWERRHVLRMEKARIEARQARQRKERLHEWTTAVVASASELTLIAPESIAEATESGHGDAREWGAATELKADFNRHILEQAPASALAMLRYKAEEAGITVNESKDNRLVVGNEAVQTRKAARRLRKQLREIA